MKLSVDTCVLREKLGDEGAILAAKKAGFDAIDYSLYWMSPERDMLGDDWEQRAHRTKRFLDETGMSCCQAHAPFVFSRSNSLDSADSEYLRLQRSIRFAAILGAPHIVIHSVGSEQDGDFWEYNRQFYISFLPVCRECGIRIAVENLFIWDEKRLGVFSKMSDPVVLESFTRSLPAPYYCNVIDIGHAAVSGSEPEAFLRKMHGDMVQGLHIQDGGYLRDDHTIPGLGEFNWDGIVSALKEIKYSGDLSLEIYRFLRGIPAEDIDLALELAARSIDRLRKKLENTEN